MIKKILLIISICILATPLLAESWGWTESFTQLTNWNYQGSTNSLYNWDSQNQNIQFHWNSAVTTSHLSHSMDENKIVTQNQSFNLEFDLTLSNLSVGSFSNYPLSIGLYNSSNSNNRSMNIMEWSYYPGTDATYGGPNWLGMSVINNQGSFMNSKGGNTFYTKAYTLKIDSTYHVKLQYNAAEENLKLIMSENGNPLPAFSTLDLSGLNISLDKFAITNWFDDTPASWGGPATFAASGKIDNISLTYPLDVSNKYWENLE